MGKKKVRALIKLELNAGKATPAPPVGTALGPHGVNIMDFCKQYNERTSQQPGEVVPAEITIFEDRSFSFVLKTPPTVFLLKKAVGLDKGSSKPNREKVGKIDYSQVVEIAKQKSQDLNAFDLDQAVRMIEGTARSMGLDVVGKEAR
jgi:large subunit ribosomal protein L11